MRLRSLVVFLILGCIWSSGTYAHPVHVSVLNIEYDESTSALRFTFRLFRDDMELAIYHNYAIQVSIDSVNTAMKAEQLMNKYLNERFILSMGGKDVDSLHFNRKVNDGIELWLYYSVPVAGKPGKIKVKNQLMMDLYFDQTNLVICGPRGKECAYQLVYNNNEFSHDFNDK